MFEQNGQRFLTRGVQERIPVELQVICWGLIDQKRRREEVLDYLQIFEIIPGPGQFLRIIHRQEQPTAYQSYTFTVRGVVRPLREKVWIIDDGDHQTMLLPEEY